MTSQKKIITTGIGSSLPFSPAVKAGGFIYASGMLSTDSKGQFMPGDVKQQTRRILDNLATVLERAGSSLQQAVSVQVYLRDPADFSAMNEVYREYWKENPPARTTVAAKLVLPEASVEISAIAVPQGAQRIAVHPSAWKPSPNPYSYGIKSGDTLFLSGLLSRNPIQNTVEGSDIKAQTRRVMENAGEILAAAGMTHADVASAKVFITRSADFQGMNEAYRSFFQKDPPARATVITGLMNPEYLVEITMVAVSAKDRTAFTTPQADGSPGQVNPNLSSAIRVGSRLFLSGMLGIKENNKGDVFSQSIETLQAIGRTLKSAGFEWPHVVDGTVYLTDMRNYAAMNKAYTNVLKADFPARATVESALVAPDGLLEIMFLAVKE